MYTIAIYKAFQWFLIIQIQYYIQQFHVRNTQKNEKDQDIMYFFNNSYFVNTYVSYIVKVVGHEKQCMTKITPDM